MVKRLSGLKKNILIKFNEVYLNDSSYRVDDMIVCDNCLLEIMKEIKKRNSQR